MANEIQLTKELETLLKKCISPKDIVRSEQEQIWNEKYLPKCLKMLSIIEYERKNNSSLSDDEFIVTTSIKYIKPFIKKVCEEYGVIISQDKLSKFIGLLNKENYIFINDPNTDHDISANSELGKIIINKAKFDYSQLEKKLVSFLGILPHELFHMLINMLKKDDGARMMYRLKNGEEVHFRPGKVGQILSEGFVEKESKDFCEKYNIFHTIDPSYTPFVELCSYIKKEANIDENFLFSKDYSDIFKLFSKEVLDAYQETERLAMLNHFQVVEYEDKKDSNHKKIMINPNQVESSYTEGLNLEKGNVL